MSILTFPVYPCDERTGEVVRRVTLWGIDARTRSATDYHVIRVGISSDAGISYFGEWSQAKNALTARKSVRMTGPSDVNRPLPLGSVCLVEVETIGTPQSLSGLAVFWRFSLVGETQPAAQGRRDGAFPHAHAITKPLFGTGRTIPDAPTREAVDAITGALNTTHLPSWTITVPLTS